MTPQQLLFLPGAGGDPLFWQPVAARLQHPARQQLFGWPGFGVVPADPKVQGLEDLVQLVVNQINQPTALVAQSMGGIIAMQAALQRPEYLSHLVLCVTSAGLDLSDLELEDWRPAFLAANPQIPDWFIRYRHDMSADIRQITPPCLLLWGDADPISPVAVGQRLNQLLPNSQLEIIAQGQHNLAQAQAALVASRIDDFLTSA